MASIPAGEHNPQNPIPRLDPLHVVQAGRVKTGISGGGTVQSPRWNTFRLTCSLRSPGGLIRVLACQSGYPWSNLSSGRCHSPVRHDLSADRKAACGSPDVVGYEVVSSAVGPYVPGT